jgi:hypothetical protein
MQRKSVLAALAGLFLSVAVSLAADANMGTWKLNEAKSKVAAGMGKNTMVVYTAAGDNIKVVVDGVLADGKPAHNEWTGKFDGKDYPLVGDPNADTRAYKTVDARTTNLVNKKAGKVTATGQIVMAADGKSRVLTVDQTDAAGKKVTSTFVYDKQ